MANIKIANLHQPTLENCSLEETTIITGGEANTDYKIGYSVGTAFVFVGKTLANAVLAFAKWCEP